MISKFLGWLKERIKHWTKPVSSVLVIGILSDLTRNRTDLLVENALLRQQLIVLKRQIKRPKLTNPDRFRLVFLSLCWLLASSVWFWNDKNLKPRGQGNSKQELLGHKDVKATMIYTHVLQRGGLAVKSSLDG